MWAQTDPISGWIQVILQGGAFALLTYIVVKQFPWWFMESRKERQECREEREKAMTVFEDVIRSIQAKNKLDRQEILAENRELIRQLQIEFKERSHSLAAAINAQTKELIQKIGKPEGG